MTIAVIIAGVVIALVSLRVATGRYVARHIDDPDLRRSVAWQVAISDLAVRSPRNRDALLEARRRTGNLPLSRTEKFMLYGGPVLFGGLVIVCAAAQKWGLALGAAVACALSFAAVAREPRRRL